MDSIINTYNKVMRVFRDSKPEVVYLLGWTFPVLVSNVLNQVVYLLVNMMFAGRLGKDELAAVSLGNTWVFCTSAFVIGTFNAMDTFISQAYGAKSYKLIGSTIQRATTTAIVFSFFITIIWFVTEPILILIHQDPVVSKLAQRYILGMIPGLWFSGALSVLQKYLQGQGIMYPSIVCGVILNIANAIFNFIFVHGLTDSGGIGVLGSSISTSISKGIATFLLLLWIYKFKLHQDTWFGFSLEELIGWSGLKDYLRLAIPAGFQMLLEGTAFELLTILSGTFGSVQLDGHSIAMNFTLLTFMLPFSISIALSVRIGQLLGSKDAQKAKKATNIGFCITMSIMVLISVTQFLSRHVIGSLYTDEVEVQQLVAKILPISALFQFFDGFQTTCQGIIRGTGKNKIGALVNFGGFYLVGVPFSCIFGFALHMEVIGLWWGLCLGLGSVAIILGFVILRINWEKEVEIALKRTETLQNLNKLDTEMIIDGSENLNDQYNDKNKLLKKQEDEDDSDDFEKFNKEKPVATLGEAILNSNFSTPSGYNSIGGSTNNSGNISASSSTEKLSEININEDNYEIIHQSNKSNKDYIILKKNEDGEGDDDEENMNKGSAILN
ncbi:hypothetical protein RB653_005336 [Dictyostelium firmibasis]|uniref:MATE efflux family protein n=1 Tax=Dictyostelium firmibasis TaxID=79012 RepID=A0AAN7UBB4_9MYCE